MSVAWACCIRAAYTQGTNIFHMVQAELVLFSLPSREHSVFEYCWALYFRPILSGNYSEAEAASVVIHTEHIVKGFSELWGALFVHFIMRLFWSNV